MVRVDGLKRIQATGDDRVWLVVDYADPAQATPDCERSRFNLKLTKDSPPDDCDVGDWYTEVVPLRLASIGGFNGPVGAQLRDLDTKIKTLVNQLIVGQFAIRMGAAAALAYAQLRLENLGLTLLDLKNELERAYVWMKFEKPGLPKLPDFSDDEPSTGNILNKFVGTVEEWRSNLAIESAWKATTLEDFYTIVASTKHVLYEKGQWTLAEGQNPAKTWNVSNIGAQSDLFLAVSDRQFSLEVTYDMDGKTVRPPHTRNFNQIERFHVLKGDRGFFAGVGDSFKITTDKRVVLLIPAG